jgi:glutamyl-Q tRNA(Asp) synthetase
LFKQTSTQYCGRFAPSPSGALHFGSLIAALGSYLQAKSQHGLWQVRIDDIDPPREIPGSAEDILNTLYAYGFQWDGDVIYQSKQYSAYESALSILTEKQLCYSCSCTRKEIKQQGGIYLGSCRNKQLNTNGNALRLNIDKLNQPITHFYDRLQGHVHLDEKQAHEDFIIKRKDGLYAYNLAVVIDDFNQGITEIVRGADLLPTTGKQISLYQLLNKPLPTYLHLPVAVTSSGHKLSKQNHALAIDKKNPIPTLLQALNFLGHRVPNSANKSNCQHILSWAIENWDLEKIPKKTEIQI